MEGIFDIFFDLIFNSKSDINNNLVISVFFSNYKKTKFFYNAVKNELIKMGFKIINSKYNFFAISSSRLCKINIVTVMEHTFGYNCDYAICDSSINDTLKDIMILSSIYTPDNEHYIEVNVSDFL